MKASLRVALVITLLLPCCSPAQEGLELPGSQRRIVAMGDVHGAYDAMHTILERAELIDRRGRWIGGDAVLVQTGDLIDRGAESLRVAEWILRLQEKAAKNGGEVVALLGNHETMNIQGDLRYVSAGMRKPFVDGRSTYRASELCDRQVRILREHAAQLELETPSKEVIRAECMEESPRGLVEYFEQFAPKEALGRKLRALPVIAKVDGVVFLHGGIGPAFSGLDVDEINRTIHGEIAKWDRLRQWMIDAELLHPAAQFTETMRGVRRVFDTRAAKPEAFPDMPTDFPDLATVRDWMIQHSDGPLWFRGFAKWTEEEADAELPALLRGLDAQHFVVGHTPQKRQLARFGGRVFLIDTGMLAEAYNGVPSVLEIRDGRFTALYPDGSELLHDCRMHTNQETP